MNAAWATLQRALFGKPHSSNDFLESSVQATWHLPLGIAALVLLAGATIAIAIYWHERPSASRPIKMLLASFRVLLMLFILLMLYGWTFQQHRTARPDVVVILDDSASMGVVDSTEDSAIVGELA